MGKNPVVFSPHRGQWHLSHLAESLFTLNLQSGILFLISTVFLVDFFSLTPSNLGRTDALTLHFSTHRRQLRSLITLLATSLSTLEGIRRKVFRFLFKLM